MARHEALINKTDFNSTLCRFCAREGIIRKETPEHIIKHCFYYDDIRRRVFGEIVMGEMKDSDWRFILKFISTEGYRGIENGTGIDSLDEARQDIEAGLGDSNVNSSSLQAESVSLHSGSLASGVLSGNDLDDIDDEDDGVGGVDDDGGING